MLENIEKKMLKQCLFIIGCLIGATCAQAQEGSAPDYAQETLTGDWGGLRPSWSEKGIDLDLGFKSDILRNIHGGIRQGGRPINQFDVKLRGDLEKLAGWENTTAYFNFIFDAGGKVNRDHVGSLMGVSNTEVAVSTHRIFHAWIDKSFGDNQWSLLAGLYPIDSEFQVIESAGIFVLPPYGPTADLSLTRGPSIFNQSAIGLRGKWQSENKKNYAMVAILDGIPGDPGKPKGTHVKFNKGDGTMQIIEAGFTPRADGSGGESAKDGPAGENAGLEKYAIGYWRYTSKVNDLVDVDAAGNAAQRNSDGWYAQAERTILDWNSGDLVTFARFSATDGNSTSIRDVTSIGARARGLIPGRNEDFFGVAFTRGRVSEKWKASQAANGTLRVGSESAIEVTYRIQATKWLAIQPLVQQIRSPGAAANVPKATLVGVKIDAAL